MKQRPWFILVIGWLHLLEPLSKILYLKFSTGFGFSVVMSNLLAMNQLGPIFEFWFLFPLGGLALLWVKPVSYPLFFAVQLYSVYAHLSYEKFTWPYVSKSPLITSVALLFFNFFIMAFLLLPQVRRLFFDRKLRWWEPKPRKQVDIACKVKVPGPHEAFEGQLMNISESGAFVSLPVEVAAGSRVKLMFDLGPFDFGLEGVVVDRHQVEGVEGLGVEFLCETGASKRAIARLIAGLELLKVSSDGLARGVRLD